MLCTQGAKGLGEMKGKVWANSKVVAAERERANLPSSGISIAGFLVQLRVFGDTDTAETDSQTDRQTDRQTTGKTGKTDV